MHVLSRRTRRLLGAVAIVAIAVVAAWTWESRESDVTRIALEVKRPGADLAGDVIVPPGVDAQHPAPAVLVAHGLGSDRTETASMLQSLLRAGYVVLAWDARGSGDSTGRVGIAAPDGEVADVSALIDLLARRDDVERDRSGDPRVAVIGTSYGGGTALLAAEADDRIDVVVPIFAWYDLPSALQPNGVLKQRWASELFGAGSADRRRPTPCGNLTAELCVPWLQSAQAGAFTPAALQLLRARSASNHPRRLDAATLVVQDQMDSLFDLTQATQLAAALERNHAPVRVEWIRGGHDLPLDRRRREHVERAVVRWLDRHLSGHGDIDPGPRFTVELGAGRGYAHSPVIPPRPKTRTMRLEPADHAGADGFVQLAVPAGGLPADITTLPGMGDLTEVDQGFEPPAGQRATFTTETVDAGLEVIGTPHVQLQLSGDVRHANVFVHLVDVAADDRQVVPRGLVTPVRVDDLPPLGSTPARSIDVALPPIAWRLAPGHHFELVVSSTDAAYVAPDAPATLAVAAAGGAGLELPIVDASDRSSDAFDSGRDWRDLLWAALAILVVSLASAFVLARRVRRRDSRVQEPALRDVPLAARGLVKRFGDGFMAVDHVSFDVAPGSVVGIIGPNGAGKTTTIRMLLGLVEPTDGFAHVFGQRVRPGSPHLDRIGALVEGPGLVPHLTGRQHLERYWSAAGGDPDDAHVDEALAAVDLTADADRVVRTWSHGMRQRLGIAQALLGRRPLVLLDEPANGLDPAQIAHLRELVRSIAADGRSVLLSSHLLGELEQVCTHVVLMTGGRVLRAGTLSQVVGDHADLEHAFLALVTADEGARDA